ncbi:uncharacterized protein LOC100677905 [Nasonia vitripennis]|uniref:Uncharacterized protein n=1 Tax=Nasonia vitripennis TaxID=7425 RepID=A0A7M7T6M7_NASVI|nr:uncharacterized protein LOC100677905 [Nasonia vitripennis]XP_031778113.1 uncharacterized protein LOC100677905 [Nasonia vitripennis]XP_031778114.1 uncharacterized protein LOC100677905 [Nasonia vitripennis]
MMLHRSTSSRRRRASRSVTNPSQSSAGQQGQPAPRSRRASVASTEPASEALLGIQSTGGLLAGMQGMDRQRSPRGSCVPNIALDTEDETQEETFNRRLLPDPEHCGASRLSLAPEANRSSRNSLVPDDYAVSRSPRGSLIPDTSGRSPRNSLIPGDLPTTVRPQRSPRHSLIPDSALSPRNSLVPLDVGYSRSPRGSLVPGSAAAGGGSRVSLMPENGSRSPRHSLVPAEAMSRSPRGSVANIDFDRSPRGSICPDTARSPRGSITPLDMHIDKKERSPRGSIVSECINQSPRGSIVPELVNRSPRGSIAPDPSRSPRGSICPESNRSPRGSIAPGHELNRSPRGSIGMPGAGEHRGSLGGAEDEPSRSPRGSIGPGSDLDRSPRGSLAGQEHRRITRNTGFAVQDPRRASADQGTAKNRSTSPYRQRGENSGSVRSGGTTAAPTAAAQVNLGYGTTNSWGDSSRRASSSVSQFSGDESRRLCAGNTSIAEKGGSGSCGGPMGVAAYGSLVFQLKDAHLEANGTCDFVFRALRVVSKTMIVTIFLAFLSTMPIFMLILGVQYIRDCPRGPNIPVYMVVGGTLGGIRMFWTLYSQIRSRRPEVLTVPSSRSHISFKKLVSVALSCFLVGWFVLGNYWILSIRWPDYAPTLFEPNQWCHKTLYIFSLAHLFIVYVVIFAGLITGLGLLFCRILACPWPERYK